MEDNQDWMYQQEQAWINAPANSEDEDYEELDFSEGSNND